MEAAVDVGASAPANESFASAADDITNSVASDTPAAAPSHDDELKSIWNKHHPARDDAGKFASRNPVEQSAPEGTDPAAQVADQTAETVVEQAKPAIDAPISWSAEQKAKWATLPPDVQTYVAQRERESHEAISRAGQQLKAYEPIGQVIQQYAHVFQKSGLQPHDGIARLMAVHEMLEADPRSAMEKIGKAYGVELQGPAPQSDNPYDDKIARLERIIEQHESKLTAQERNQLAAERAREDANNAALAREIEDFAKDKPHFEAVRGIMAGLMSSGAANDLKEAYERAVYADPTIRQSMIADEQSKAEAKRKADEAERVKKAKQAAGVNVKSSPGSTVSAKTMEDDLRAIWTKNHGS
jgi:hypothetical protein